MQLLYINILFPAKNYLYSGCKLVLFWLYLQSNIATMGQIAFTVRMDEEIKRSFDELCRDFGMSSNTAFNIFARTVIKRQMIPFDVESEKRAVIQRGQMAFEQLRLQAEQNNLGDLTLEEINEEIRLARSERHAKEARNPR